MAQFYYNIIVHTHKNYMDGLVHVPKGRVLLVGKIVKGVGEVVLAGFGGLGGEAVRHGSEIRHQQLREIETFQQTLAARGRSVKGSGSRSPLTH